MKTDHSGLANDRDNLPTLVAVERERCARVVEALASSRSPGIAKVLATAVTAIRSGAEQKQT